MTAFNKQALRVLAVALDGDDWHAEGNSVYGGAYDVGDSICYDHIASCESVNGESPHADFIAAASPATVLALLDELEAAEKRIAELEARSVTVQLPADNAAESESPEDDATAWFDEGWNARGKADKEALIAAGIGVKGE